MTFVRVFLLMPCGRLLGKRLTSWLSFVMSNCVFVTFPLVSLVRCGTWLYWFLIFALFPTLISMKKSQIISAGISIRCQISLLNNESQMCCVDASWDNSVTYHLWVIVTLILISDLVSRIYIVSGTYLLYYLRSESQIWCVDASLDNGVSHIIYWSLWPWTLTCFFRIRIVSGAYPIFLEVELPNLVCGCILGWLRRCTILGSLWSWPLT